VKPRPQLLEDRLKGNSISADEVRAAVRKAGFSSFRDVKAVVLENDGNWSVVGKSEDDSDDSAMFGLPIPGRPSNSPKKKGHEAEPAGDYRLP
jgi:uncharacterized membrane protein YcaP (DUF421 family)